MSNDNPFNILGSQSTPPNAGRAVETAQGNTVEEKIKGLLASSDVFLFMKGTPDFPQCGFSANSVGILNAIGKEFKTFDILTDMDLRQGLKEFSNWPTYPQLYFKGELLGGNDIITEMFESGELQKLFS